MRYHIEISSSCDVSIKRAIAKNPVLKKAIRKKMEQIVENPERFKHLRYGLKGERRVHILKSFVLRYEVKKM